MRVTLRDDSRDVVAAMSRPIDRMIDRRIFVAVALASLAVPLIAAWGLPLFTLVTATATLVLIVWGIRRGAPSAAAGTRAAAHRPKRLVNG